MAHIAINDFTEYQITFVKIFFPIKSMQSNLSIDSNAVWDKQILVNLARKHYELTTSTKCSNR